MYCICSTAARDLLLLTVQQQENDMLLRWSIVDSTECGFPSPIQSYVIYYEEELSEDRDFLAATTDTFCTHENVVLFAPTMSYEVVATDVEIGLVRSFAQPDISRAEFEAALQRVQRQLCGQAEPACRETMECHCGSGDPQRRTD